MYAHVENLFNTYYNDEWEAIEDGYILRRIWEPYYKSVKHPIVLRPDEILPNGVPRHISFNRVVQKALDAGKTEYELFEFIGDIDTIPINIITHILQSYYGNEMEEIILEGFMKERSMRALLRDRDEMLVNMVLITNEYKRQIPQG